MGCGAMTTVSHTTPPSRFVASSGSADKSVQAGFASEWQALLPVASSGSADKSVQAGFASEWQASPAAKPRSGELGRTQTQRVGPAAPAIVRAFRIHPEWQCYFNMLRVRRGIVEDATTYVLDTKLASQNNEVVAVIRDSDFKNLVVDIDVQASTDNYWKLAPSMHARLGELGATVADFDVAREGFIIKRFCTGGPPLLNSLEALVDEAPGGEVSVHPAYWAITLEQLSSLAAAASAALGQNYPQSHMLDVVEHVIKPETARPGKCYALVKNRHVPLLLDVFVSHCWSECFCEFVESIHTTFRTWLSKPRLWICATALFQTDDRSVVAEQVGQDPSRAPFTQALKHAGTFLVVRNAQVDLYTRVWCVWELFLAERLGITALPGGMQVAGPDAFRDGVRVDIASCRASDDGDRRRILDHVWELREKVNTIATLVKNFG